MTNTNFSLGTIFVSSFVTGSMSSNSITGATYQDGDFSATCAGAGGRGGNPKPEDNDHTVLAGSAVLYVTSHLLSTPIAEPIAIGAAVICYTADDTMNNPGGGGGTTVMCANSMNECYTNNMLDMVCISQRDHCTIRTCLQATTGGGGLLTGPVM